MGIAMRATIVAFVLALFADMLWHNVFITCIVFLAGQSTEIGLEWYLIKANTQKT